MDAFDADVLIYAAVPGHPLGSRMTITWPAPGQAPATDTFVVAAVVLDRSTLGRNSMLCRTCR